MGANRVLHLHSNIYSTENIQVNDQLQNALHISHAYITPTWRYVDNRRQVLTSLVQNKLENAQLHLKI